MIHSVNTVAAPLLAMVGSLKTVKTDTSARLRIKKQGSTLPSWYTTLLKINGFYDHGSKNG